MEREIELSWPADIPLPSIAYSGNPINGSIFSPNGFQASIRRSRFVHSYHTLRVAWMLKQSQYDDLRTFYEDDLGSGTAQFKMELRFPKNSDLDNWVVLFLGPLLAVHEEGFWNVKSVLGLASLVEV